MRKFTKISAALAAMVLVLSFAGCSDGGSSNGDGIVGGSSSESGSGSGSSSGGSSSSGSGSSSSGDSSGSSSGGSSESENISLKGTYWTLVEDKGTYWEYGGEYYYFTSDTAATRNKYNGDYEVDGEMTFSVSGNVLTAITYAGVKLGEGEWAGYSGSLTFSDPTMVEILTSPGKTEAKNFKKVDSKPTGITREDKSSSSSSGSGSSGSESDDDWKTILPSSQGENPLSGNFYSYVKNDGSKKISIVFTEDTAVETEIKTKDGKSESSISEYKYTYNADKGLLYLKVVSWTVDGEKITSSDEFFEFAAREFDMTVEEARELLADYNVFEGYETRNCFKKDESTVVFGDYFDGKITGGEFNYYVSGGIRIKLDDGITVKNNATEYEYEDGEFASDKKTFIFSNDENVQVSGSWSTVENASKTLKELYEETNSYSDKEAESNGYIIVKFSKLSSEMQSSPFNMDTNSSYKFIFDTNPKDFTKTN